MKRAFLFALLLAMVAETTGCCLMDRATRCRQPRGRRGEACAVGSDPTAQVAYPYYTTRGPRDFLAKNPPSIGP
jgi:hypothetical protein